nr:nucleotide sugar dehydrogenase [Bacillus sp. WMMC1349]
MGILDLIEKINSRQANIGIVGLGYVGLPLCIAFAQTGFRVTGIDLNQEKVDILNKGYSYITDVKDEDIQFIVDNGHFKATTEFSCMSFLDAICICVPTPLNKNLDPDLSAIEYVVDKLKKHLRPGTLVVLESTTYPGTTEERIEKALALTDLHAGIDYHLCYSPERVDPGNKKYTILNTPKVIGGVTNNCLKLAETLYGTIVNQIFPVSTPKVAEVSKLLENTFRSINIAFINEMALMCDSLGVNIWEVIKAASTKPFGFMPFYPGPGIGGHCIPLDPMYLTWRAKEENFFSRFIELSQDINRNMPKYVVGKISELLNAQKKCVNGGRILLLGMAYKPDVNDHRESPSLNVYELLKEKGAVITVNDPFCDHILDVNDQQINIQTEMNYEELCHYDLIALLTAHSTYDFKRIAESGVPILDTRNAFNGLNTPHVTCIGDVLKEAGPVISETVLAGG